MSQDHIKKEALFNEVKGSLFEYLVARRLSADSELTFMESLDKNYLNVLSQQDRMVRQFYPEMIHFLQGASELTAASLLGFLKFTPSQVRLMGKYSSSSLASEIFEADLLIWDQERKLPLSLKLNKQNSFVNTKSGGIKSFFSTYFSFLSADVQSSFSAFVDQEFFRMAHELHALNDKEFEGDFHSWVQSGKSELPGELSIDERGVLKAFYARVALRMHEILSSAAKANSEAFGSALPALMGFSSPEIIQVICFHDFKTHAPSQVEIHTFKELLPYLNQAKISEFGDIASVEVKIGPWLLQLRVKPMNKFTTTAIKINCAVRFRPSSV